MAFADAAQAGAVHYSLRGTTQGSTASPPRLLPGFEGLGPPAALSVSGAVVLGWVGEEVRILDVQADGFLDLRYAFTWPVNASKHHTTVATALVTRKSVNTTAGVLLLARMTKDAEGSVWLRLWSLSTLQQG